MVGHTLNPVVLIVGAASPIGVACARRLSTTATGGLILVDAREEGLAATADALHAPPERVSMLPFDITDAAWWTRACDFITAQYGRLDWAIINVGLWAPGAADANAGAQDGIVIPTARPNGAVLALQALAPLIRRNTDGGAIVILSSLVGLRAEGGLAAYATKADLLQLVRAAAKQGGPDYVRVNAVVEDAIDATTWRDAPMFHDLVREKGGDRGALDALAETPKPLARIAGAGDFANLALMLLAEHSPITGATLVVDGGYAL